VVFPPQREREFRQLAKRAEEETDEKALRALLPVSRERFLQALAEKKGMADPVDGFRRVLVSTRVYLGAALELLAEKPQLTMVYVIGTDEVGHVLAPYLPPPLPGADPAFSQVAQAGVERYFSVVDRWLGRLLQECPLTECTLLLVSDHGFKWGEDRPRAFSGVAAATAALWHRPQGIFLLAGRGVEGKGRVPEPASVYDVAPTVAALLGIPQGTTWRGRPLPGVAQGKTEKMAWGELVPPESYRPKVSAAPPSQEAVAQLKALGYLEGSEGEGRETGATEGELNNLGLVHLEAKRYQQAEEAFRQALAKNPAYASPYYNLRRLYFETGRYDQADQALEEAIKRGLRDGVGAMARAVEDYQRAGLWERALRLLARARELFPQEARFAAQQLAYLLQQERCPQALALAGEAAQQFAEDPAVLAFSGLAAACAGDKERAKSWLAQSLQRNPNQPEVRQALQALESQ
jgi:tetratricopeptide (TPR) repeat protein